jgi:hypothetical protein
VSASGRDVRRTLAAHGAELATLAVLVAAVVHGVRRIHSFDVFWYLRSGEEILARHALPAVDPLSYTSSQPWLNHEWLAELILALLHRLGGFAALTLLQALVVGLCLLLALLRPRPAGATPAAAGGSQPWYSCLGLALAAVVLGETAEPRAQLLSWLLFSATFALALRDRVAPSHRLFWALPLQLLWTNIHGGNPDGVAVLALLFLSAPSRRRTLVALASAALTMAGPYGFHVHEHFLGAHGSLPEIREWSPLGAALAGGSFAHGLFVVLAGAAALVLVRRRGRGEAIGLEALLLAAFVALALRYARFAGEAALVAAFVLAAKEPLAAPARHPRLRLLAPVLALCTLGLAGWQSRRAWGLGLADGRFPVEAVAWLRSARPPGPMFNSFNFGGYLLWAYPEEKVFIDGRAFTVYADALFRELLAVYDAPERFTALEARWGFRLAVLQSTGRGQALLDWLRRQPGWAVVHEDARATVLQKR